MLGAEDVHGACNVDFTLPQSVCCSGPDTARDLTPFTSFGSHRGSSRISLEIGPAAVCLLWS